MPCQLAGIWAGIKTGVPAAERIQPALLRKTEQIQGPKNAPIARFDGLCCYQSRSKINERLRNASGRGNRLAASP